MVLAILNRSCLFLSAFCCCQTRSTGAVPGDGSPTAAESNDSRSHVCSGLGTTASAIDSAPSPDGIATNHNQSSQQPNQQHPPRHCIAFREDTMGATFTKFCRATETPEQRRERLTREHGILMPPRFVNSDTLPLSRRADLLASDTPSLLDILWCTNPGARLLEEQITPGITLSVPTTSGGSIIANLRNHHEKAPAPGEPTAPTPPASSSLSWSAGTTFWASHPLPAPLSSEIELLVPTDRPPSVNLIARINGTALTARSGENGWVEARHAAKLFPHHNGGMGLLVSAWTTTESLRGLAGSVLRKPPPPGALVGTDHPPASGPGIRADPPDAVSAGSFLRTPAWEPSVHLQAGLEHEESVLTFQTEVPLGALTSGDALMAYTPRVDTLLSINLNHQPPAGRKERDDDAPPLWLTLKHQPTRNASSPSWILNLAQVVSFDRVVVNPLEERAPNIRQTLGWALQVEKDDAPETKALAWKAGATYQWNRAMACKALLNNGETLTYGLMLKRWNQPRITLSILRSYDFSSSKHSFLGFGLEVESSPVSLGSPTTAAEYPDAPPGGTPLAPPPTRVHLPEPHQRR